MTTQTGGAPFESAIRGNLVLPDRELRDGWLAVAEGRIAAIGTGPLPPLKGALHDFSGKWVFPGLVDGHVHCGSGVGWDGIAGTTRCAAMGGTTTCVDMPYDVPEKAESAEIFRRKAARMEELAHVDVALYGTIRKEGGVEAIPDLVEAGACALKFSTYENSPTRFPRISHTDMRTAFGICAELDRPISIHNEDQELIDSLIARFREEGKTGPEWHEPSRPPLSELLANLEVFEIGAETGARVHIAHSSLARGFDQAAAYRAQGHRMSAETCIQYLVFSNEDMVRMGAKAKVNPPIRPLPEREALWERLLDGKIQFVSTDHAPWGPDKKSNPVVFDNISGARGIETLLHAFYTEAVVRRGLPVGLVAKYLALEPARHFGLYPRKGALTVGGDADVAVLDPAVTWTFDETQIPDEPRSSIYHGREFTGRVVATFVRGVQVFGDGEVLVDPGFGSFVRPVAG